MKVENKLARIFVTLAETGERLESTAAGVFAIVKAARVKSVSQWDKLVRAAYEANGWNARPGRPATGAAQRTAVPGTVRTYVTTIRRAIRTRMNLARFHTFTALRKALEARDSGAPRRSRKPGAALLALPAPVRENFAGVSLVAPAATNGALFHDIPVVYAKLPDDSRTLFEKQLRQLLKRYERLVPAEEVRKAA